MMLHKTLAILFASAATLPGQVISTVAAQVQMQGQGLISVTFENTLLEDAIRTISRRSGRPVAFVPKLLPPKKVTYRAENVSPELALNEILRGTEINVKQGPDGSLGLVRGARNNSSTAHGVIAGKVTDSKTGRGVMSATVSAGDTHRASTSDDGSYRITSLSAGTYVVTVRLVGYAKQSRSVTVGEGATVMADFKLEPSANVLDQVVVTGTVIASELKAVPNAITIITAKQIEERGITRIDQLFRGDIPGLFSVNAGSFATLDTNIAMFSRGATRMGTIGDSRVTEPVKTYVDGVEMATPNYINQIDPRSIERIEILTGPQASTIYGSNAINGVIQIFTKRGTSNRPQLSLSLVSGLIQNNFRSTLAPIHNYNVNATGIESRFSYNFGGSWDYTGAWTPGKQNQRFGGYAGAKMQTARFSVDGSARRGITLEKQRGGNIQPVTALQEQGIYTRSATDAANGTKLRNNFALRSTTTSLTLQYQPFARWSHELFLGNDVGNVEWMRIAPSFLVRGGDTTLAISDSKTGRVSQRYVTSVQLPLTDVVNLALTSGVDHWRTSGSSFGSFTAGALTGSLASPTITRNRPFKNTGGFVQTQLNFWESLFITYGLRAEWNPNYGEEAQPNMAPRYGVAYTRGIGDITAKVRASYGRSTRPPSPTAKLAIAATDPVLTAAFGQFNSMLGNPDLGPESQQGGEGGLEVYIGNLASLTVTRYNQTVNNLISVVNPIDSIRSLAPITDPSCPTFGAVKDADGYCYYKRGMSANIGSIRNQGWELQGTSNIGPFSLKGTYSWSKSRVIGVTAAYKSLFTHEIFQPGAIFGLFPEHTGAFNVTYAHSGSTVGLNINAISTIYTNSGILESDISRCRLVNCFKRFAIPSGYRYPGAGYATADLNASHRFSAKVDGLLQIQNLGDYYRNDVSSQYASIGRQTRAGLRIRY